MLPRLAVYFQNAGIGIGFVFIPVFGKEITGSIFDAGLSLTIFYLAQIVAGTYFGSLSDKFGDRLLFIRIGFITSAIVFGAAFGIDDTIGLFLVMGISGFTIGMIISPLIAYAYDIQEEKRRTASVISVTTLGWVSGIIITGIFNEVSTIFPIMAGMFLAGFIVSLFMKTKKIEKIPEIKLFGVIKKNKRLFFGLLSRQSGAAALVTVLPLYLIEELHAKLQDIVIVYVINMVIAFLVMHLLGDKIKFRYEKSFKIGIMFSVIAFAGMPIVQEWYQIIPFMLLAGATWSFMYVGGTLYLMKEKPKSAANGLFNSTFAMANVVGPLLAGIIASMLGYVAVAWTTVILVIAASIAVSKMHTRRRDQVPDFLQ